MKIFRYAFALLLALLWICAAVANTLQEKRMYRVLMTRPLQGVLQYKSELQASIESVNTYRIRCKADLIIEDILVSCGDHVFKGDPIASVFKDAVDECINKGGEQDYIDYLKELKSNGYVIYAEFDGVITEINMLDGKISHIYETIYKIALDEANEYIADFQLDEFTAKVFFPGDIVYYSYELSEDGSFHKYVKEALILSNEQGNVIVGISDNEHLTHGMLINIVFEKSSKQYEYIIPKSYIGNRISPLNSQMNIYTVKYAVPSSQDSTKYTVIIGEAKVIDQNKELAAIEFPYNDKRSLILYSENVFQGQVVKEDDGLG